MKRQTRSKKKNMRQVAFTRFMLVVAVFVLWIGGISVRLVHLQVNQHSWHKEKALDMRQDVKTTRMLRGMIMDRNERKLAMSLPVKTLYADPTEIVDIDAAARSIAKGLKLDADQLAAQLRQAKEEKKRFIAIVKKVEDDLVQKINKALDDPTVKKADSPNFTGLHWRDEQRRSYPYQTLAAHVIGYSDAADEGKAGIEQSQDDVLHGAVIRKLQERDRLGRVYEETVSERSVPSDIVLTIDAAFQNITEQALERGVKAAEAKSGMAIVMRPKTGEILAMANFPTFDPNLITTAEPEYIGNKAIQTVYSPGSVFKIVTYGSALERNLFSPDELISAGNGSITVADHTFTDSHGVGTVTYTQAMAHSSNVCAIKTGIRVGKDDFFAMIQKMGFGAKTGVELPAETVGIVRSPAKWNGDSLASMSIGYEIGVTALQMAAAFATIANDGVRFQPHVIKEIRHSNDRPKTVTEVKQTQVVTAETARKLKTMLRQVVLTGTGRRAALNGYTAAGKTGTAWKFDARSKSVDSSKYVSSFIGMAPADDPEVVIAVVMDEPKAGSRDGGMVSAPVFREIAQQLLAEMKVPTDSPIKAETLVAQVLPKTEIQETEKTATEKPTPDKKVETTTKSKAVQPSQEKTKPEPQKKKTTEKKLPEAGKLTADMRNRFSFFETRPKARAKFET
jgi:cell division protein FtsI (penicillin-binding protein 3)